MKLSERLRIAEENVARLTNELEAEKRVSDAQKKLAADYKKYWLDDGTKHRTAIEKHRAAIESLVRAHAEIHEMVVEATFADSNPTHAWLGEVRKKITTVLTKETLEIAFSTSLTMGQMIAVGVGTVGLVYHLVSALGLIGGKKKEA